MIGTVSNYLKLGNIRMGCKLILSAGDIFPPAINPANQRCSISFILGPTRWNVGCPPLQTKTQNAFNICNIVVRYVEGVKEEVSLLLSEHAYILRGYG